MVRFFIKPLMKLTSPWGNSGDAFDDDENENTLNIFNNITVFQRVDF